MISGYRIIDLGGANFTIGTAKTIPGTYAAIEGTQKPILLSNFAIGGVERSARFLVFGVGDDGEFISDATISAATDLLRVHVTDDDEVSFVVNE